MGAGERERLRQFNEQRIRFALAGLEAEEGRLGYVQADGRRVAPIVRLHDRRNAKYHPKVVRGAAAPKSLLVRCWRAVQDYVAGRSALRSGWPRLGGLGL